MIEPCLAAAAPQMAPCGGRKAHCSVIPITRIMEGLRDRGRALGTHWWNPPFLVPLVEVIGTERTTQDAIDRTMALHTGAGKTPVHVRRDVPGFIGNRLVKASFGRRLGVLGPLETADLVGTDLTLAIHHTVLPAIEARPGPSRYLEQLVADGRFGMWTDAEMADRRARGCRAALRATSCESHRSMKLAPKVIIACAITGGIRMSTLPDALPCSRDETAEQAIAAVKAGAAMRRSTWRRSALRSPHLRIHGGCSA